MYSVTKLLFIICTILVIKALSEKVDGGTKLSSTENVRARTEESPKHLSLYRKHDDEIIREDEDRLRKAAERLRQQAVDHRSQMPRHLRYGRKSKKYEDPKEEDSVLNFIKSLLNWIFKVVKVKVTKNVNDIKNNKTKKVAKYNHTNHTKNNKMKKSKSEVPDDYSDYSMLKKSTKPLVRTPKDNFSDRDSSEESGFREDSDNPGPWKGLISNGDAISSSFEANKRFNVLLDDRIENRATDATRTSWSDPHKVRDDAKITEFTNHLYKNTMKVFDTIEKKTKQEHIRKQIKDLARSYEDKFKGFLRDTSKQTIKTRLGTQKVILSTIEMSDRILRRLLNYMAADLNEEEALRSNDDSANTFRKAIEDNQKLQMERACKKFGICRTGPVFSTFIVDVLSIILKLDSKKYVQTINALIKAVKNTNLENILDERSENKLKSAFEKVDAHNLKPMLVVLKNIITNKNKPIIVNNLATRPRIVNSTITLLEIIDVLDQKIVTDKTKEWTNMKKDLEDFSSGKRNDINEMMEVIVKHITKSLKALDKASQRKVSKNLSVILNNFQ